MTQDSRGTDKEDRTTIPDFGGQAEEDNSEQLLQGAPVYDDDQIEQKPDILNKGKKKLQPMTPLAASSTIVNLLLATGPYTYPYGYCALGPLISAPLLFMTAVLAWVSATYVVEALSVANTVQKDRRRNSLFSDECYKTPQLQRKSNDADAHMKESEFYIRQKLELGVMADRLSAPWFKYFIMFIMILYMYGAMALKYVSGAESLYNGLSFMFTGNEDQWYQNNPWIYYVAITIFFSLALSFSFGDIENAKTLQIFTSIFRVVFVILIYFGMGIDMAKDGLHKAPLLDWAEQSRHLATVFGNTVFVFIYHHSIPGIVYPIRPQSSTTKMFALSHILGASLLFIEGQMAFYAFSSYPNDCKESIPCKPSGLFNENFQDIPFIGQVVQFYPMLNSTAVPILTITLRNNLLSVIPIKKWIKQSGTCLWLLDDTKRSVKGAWSAIFSIPAIILVMITQDPQALVTYTGGICGTFILFLFPLKLVHDARQRMKTIGGAKGENPNASPFQSRIWWWVILLFAITTLTFVMIGIITGTAGE